MERFTCSRICELDKNVARGMHGNQSNLVLGINWDALVKKKVEIYQSLLRMWLIYMVLGLFIPSLKSYFFTLPCQQSYLV